MLQFHYIRVSFARPILFLAIGLALVALGACSSEPDDTPSSSNSGGGNPPISGTSSSSDEGTSSIGVSSSSSDGGTSSADGSSSSSGKGTSSAAGGSSSSSSSNPGSGSVDIPVENAIKIEFKNGSAPAITNTFSEVKITPTSENVVITIPDAPDDKEPKYNFVISGTAKNGTVKFHGDARKSLYLNGANITNSTGPAINIQGSKRVNVHLVNGTTNFLTDAPGYRCTNVPKGEEQAKGTFFSEGKLEFDGGNGSLEVKGKCNHAIAVDNSFEIKSGKIIVKESVNDGIHVNDKIEVKGGELDLTSVGDAIQSEKKAESQNVPQVSIIGGKVKILTTGNKSHGIASDSGAVSIGGNATIQISVSGNGSKGIRARNWVEFIDQSTTTIETKGGIYTDEDSDDGSNAAGIKSTEDIFIEGGTLTIKSTGQKARGISTEKNVDIEAKKTVIVNIEADDNAIKATTGILTIKSGTVTLKSKTTKAINAGTYNKKGGTVNITEVK